MSNAFQLEELEGQVALVTFDTPNQKVNTISQAIRTELSEIVDQLEQQTDLQGLLFRSGKSGQFIAGADLNEIGQLPYSTPEQMKAVLAAGHELYDRLSQLPYPTVALVDGNSMGGGTELILALDYRIISQSPKTKIALPEVNLGLFPAWGGTQRLPRLIGIQHAIQMICAAETLTAQRAVELEFAFDAVPAEDLVSEGLRLIQLERESDRWRQVRTQREQPLGMSPDQMHFTFGVAEAEVQKKTKGQYPAPLAALKAMREGVNLTLAEGLKVEQEIALEIFGSQTAANMVAVFFMNNLVAKDPGLESRDAVPQEISRVGVLGAGRMGAGIATAHARSKIPTRMVDVDDQLLADGVRRAQEVVAGRIKIGRASSQDLQEMLGRLSTSTSHQLFTDCDLVIEAITEDEQTKTKVYQQLKDVLKPDAILASNTSTISITRMAESAPDPERFVGMHFFNPVDRMQLVEVIRGAKTSDQTIATAVAVCKRLRKTPIVVNDCPGFLVNRILFPYMNESLMLLTEGAPMDTIDRVATKFGFPMGPIALHDLVGLDVAYFAAKVLKEAFGERAVLVPLIGQLVQAGRLGQKAGQGFRQFEGKRGKPSYDPDIETFLQKNQTKTVDFSEQDIQDRLIFPMLFEAVRCLEEKIVKQPAHLDLGLLLGIGFPAFQGGILRWYDNQNQQELQTRFDKYRDLGPRFEPPQLLQEMAQSGTLFYPRP